uniref:Uncharacterized protein LOC101497010 isoform X2 n=1 Tax=Cicer arietinum TaxID=3827 RepID=A0A3Q7XDV1_CICAR|nr:uncharacterized protein LOC101497010 isoform X2 [Cicer arietinum]
MHLLVFPQLPYQQLMNASKKMLQGSNAVAEANSDDGGVTREGMYKGTGEEMGMSSDAAREGPIKAEEEGDMVRDTAKDSMDGAWIAATNKVRDCHKDEGQR